ncbi:MAG: hypothetical protein VYE16_04510, partial [Cyanobacteriota bacterium]|nr:hypothetical protein [Cyanobacteriota bacterium]
AHVHRRDAQTTGQGRALARASGCRVAFLINSCRLQGVDGVHRVAQKISTMSPLSPLTWGVGSSTAEA